MDPKTLDVLAHWEDQEQDDEGPVCKTCRYCGFGPLEWYIGPNGKWRLFETKRGGMLKPHICKEYKKK